MGVTSKSAASQQASRRALRKGRTTSLQALFGRANEGDPAALAGLREAFDADPALWEQMGDIARQAESALVALMVRKNTVVGEAYRRKVEALKRELAGPNPTVVERMLAERAALCWLFAHYADAVYVQHAEQLSLTPGEFFQRQQDRAHRRYVSSIRTLVHVRRLLAPAVQVNIGQNQVNVT